MAGWVSLFTLHVIWPFLWIWATLYREERGWGFSEIKQTEAQLTTELETVRQQLARLDEKLDVVTTRLSALEGASPEG